MITGQEFLERLETAFPDQTQRRFTFPFTHIDVVASDFPEDPDERICVIANRTGLTEAALQELCNRLFLRLEPRRPGEPDVRPANRGEFWMRALQEAPSPPKQPACRVIHFYGYKGGQGRSTLLAFLSEVLAADGWRVLVVDMDAEAPSLDVLYGAAAADMASTIIGLRAELPLRPLRAYTPQVGDGYVDLCAFRPPEARYDLDAAALSMELSIHPPSQQAIIRRLVSMASTYDVLLVDHRTGLAPTVLPWVAGLPGPVVAFARMDGQWRGARRHLGPLWRGHAGQPGVLVSALPPGEEEEHYARETEEQALELLEELVDAFSSTSGDESEAEIVPEDLLDHWVLWPFDPAFGRVQVPDPKSVGGPVLKTIGELRRLLELTGVKKHVARILHPSGGADEGHLIQTRALRELSTPNNPYTFILGRKGTGKTRLLRALADARLGEALLVPIETPESLGGIVGEDRIVQQAVSNVSEPEKFWWSLIAAALSGPTTARARMRTALDTIYRLQLDPIDFALQQVASSTGQRVFMIDGLETAFPRERTFAMLAALFRVTTALDADPVLREHVRLRIFVRTDLAQRGFENFEQQSFGKTLNLAWDTQSILNFALSRIEQLNWFRHNFPDATADVSGKLPDLLLGSVSVEACEALLMRYFPHRLGRTNINTTTFLRTWFSDDPKAETSFYPRVYDEFLRVIAGENRLEFSGPELIDGRLSPRLIYYAHARATERFLHQVKSELLNIVDLSERQLTDLLDAMKDTITPFVFERRADELAGRSGLSASQVRPAMERMKRLGIFEDRPQFTGQWRVGRLFKSSLGMIYDRRRKADPDESLDH